MQRFVTVAVALAAVVYADVSHLGYSYQQPGHAAPRQSFAPAPVHHPAPAYQPASTPQSSYVPPLASSPPAAVHHSAPAYQPAPVHHQPAAGPAVNGGYSYNPPQGNQGYRYKAVRRVVYRRRL